MLDDSLIKSIEATGEILDLDESVIEKDYHVTQVIHSFTARHHSAPFLFVKGIINEIKYL